jgi:hypothetical protein
MPKRFNDKMRSVLVSVLVKFEHYVTYKEVMSELKSMGVSGFKVSTLINRWVVEVPFWKEKEFIDQLAENELVELVYENGEFR